MRKVSKIILHCSASDLRQHDSIAWIKKIHKERGFDTAGYHYYITKMGRLEIGRHIGKIGAHTLGENTGSVGICLGGLTSFTDLQFITLYRILRNLFDVFGLDESNLYGHNEFNKNKTCPVFSVEEIKKDMKTFKE